MFLISTEEFEKSFLPYERDGEESPFPVSPSMENILGSMDLTELEKKILSSVKKITIIEFKKENENDEETLPIVSFISNDSKAEEVKSISKRAISPKYKSAAISFFGAILSGSPNGFQNSANRRGTTSFSRTRGKRSVEGSL